MKKTRPHARGKSDIWQAKTCRRKNRRDGDRRAQSRTYSLKSDAEAGVKYFWSNRPKPSHLK
jgi:hypothetical protein